MDAAAQGMTHTASPAPPADLQARFDALIGWGFSGIYVRELAKRTAPLVRKVITLGTPAPQGSPAPGTSTRVRQIAPLRAHGNFSSSVPMRSIVTRAG